MKQHILKLVVGLSLIGSICFGQSVEPRANITRAPEFDLFSTAGEKIGMKDYKGKFVVVHIATTWCPYCNAEAPYLEEVYQEYRNKNVEVLIIDVKESKELVTQLIKNRFNLSFPVLLDTDGAVAARFAPADVLPELARDEIMLASNLLIDPDGNIQFMSLLDTKNFDVKLVNLKKRLNELL
nr:redoxin domain-containing protein [Allomuricauda sp.]